MNIKYFKKDGEFMVAQTIEGISLYDLEGSIDKVVSSLQKKKTYLSKEVKVQDRYNDGFIVGTRRENRTKLVKFDYCQIEVGPDYDGEDELQIVGYRKMTDTEKVVFEKEEQEKNAEQLERKRQQYEQLKRELGS